MRAAGHRFTVVMIMLGLLTPLSLLALGLAAQAQDSFDRRTMLQSIVDHVILPGQADFTDASQALSAAAELYVAAPDVDSMAALQEAWRETGDAWSEIALLNLDLRLTSYHNQIYKPPPNYDFIDDILAGDDEISEAYVDGIGSTSKGLDAMEYLIFVPEKAPFDIVDVFKDERRRQFVLALAQNIERKAGEIRDYWSPAGRNFAGRLVRADQEGGVIQGAINMLANKIFVTLQTDLEMWLGEPSGIALDGEPHPDLVESPQARHSLRLIAHRLIGLQKIFNGGTGEDHLGFDDYLDFLGAEAADGSPLSEAINQRFDKALKSTDEIVQPLALAVIDAPDDIAALYEDLRQLQILLRADMKSHLSIVITLSDRDGDQ